MTYPASPDDAGDPRVRPDSGRFWAGGVATAVVAALVALVGILICRWTLGIPTRPRSPFTFRPHVYRVSGSNGGLGPGGGFRVSVPSGSQSIPNGRVAPLPGGWLAGVG